MLLQKMRGILERIKKAVRKVRKMLESLARFALPLLVVAGVALLAFAWRKGGSGTPQKETLPEPATPDAPQRGKTTDDLLEERFRLEREIVRLVGGGTGLQMLRRKILADPEQNKKAYSGVYMYKREKLEQLFAEYKALMKEGESLPKGHDFELLPMRDAALYQELIDFRPED